MERETSAGGTGVSDERRNSKKRIKGPSEINFANCDPEDEEVKGNGKEE